ncbi:uncharacterized protein LOC144884900 isoform X1 [Branchiostoma floridae x Branchiostoma japonicum]
MAWDISRCKLFDRRFDTRTALTVTGCALGIYGLYRLVKNRAIVCDYALKLLRAVTSRTVCSPKESKQNRLIVQTVKICGVAWITYIVYKRFGGQFYTTNSLVAFGAVGLLLLVPISYGVWTSTPKDSSKRKPRPAFKPRGPVAPGEVKDELCVVAADQHTLSTIAEEVREATADSFYPVREHRVSNRRDVADLPLYRRAICCVRNAERNISFNKHGEPEPDADLGFRAFHKMEASVGQSGVLLLLFDHAESQGISDLYSMEGLTPSQRLLDTAKDSPCRFLTVYRNLTIKQKEFIKTWVKP